ncbi:MAG: cell division protein FtsL [Candidatus Neomarinimicrobiota bacterium]
MKANNNRKPKTKVTRNLILFMGFISVVLLAVLYLWIFNHTNLMFREVEDLKRKEAMLATQNRMISMDINRLSRADRITEIASTQLEMVTPIPETIAVIINTEILTNK